MCFGGTSVDARLIPRKRRYWLQNLFWISLFYRLRMIKLHLKNMNFIPIAGLPVSRTNSIC
jgi:hypothetical protein